MGPCQFRIISSYIYQEEFKIINEQELEDFLKSQLKFGNHVVLLESPSSGNLTVGVGTPYGFVEFMDKSGEPPYLIASKNIPNNDNDFYVEFDSGGTSTPIPANKCLPFDNVIEIAKYFMVNNELPNYVNWIEV